jgi:hypothetical protein
MSKLQKPVITDYTDAQHNHSSASTGGALSPALTFASVSEINTGTDNTKPISSLGMKGSKYARKSFVIAMS